MSLRAAALLLSALLAAAPLAAAAGRAHVHGVATLSVSIEGQDLRVLLDAPMEVLVGFEHAPRSAAERQALQRARDLLAGPALLQPDADAACVAQAVKQAADGGAAQQAPGHADIEHEFAFRCAQPARLRAIEVGLFEAFPRLQKVDAVVVTASGQSRRSLQRPQRSLRLAR